MAWPELRVCVPQAEMFVPPSLKATVPGGVPEPGATALTVAVKVTEVPRIEGLAEELSPVVVSALFTVWEKFDDVLVLKLVSPLYTAVIWLWLPTLRLVVVHVAWPEPRVCVPQPVMVEPPSRKFTVPLRAPEPGAVTLTVAVNVTDWPNTDGLGDGDEVTAVLVEAWFTVWVKLADVLPRKLASPL